MPLGTFRLNGIAKLFSPSGPVGTGWGAYNGSLDGAIFTRTDTTYGVTAFGADLMTPNAVLNAYAGNVNIANNCRIGRFTWDANNNLTYTFIVGNNRENQRSLGNFLQGQLFTPSVRRLTQNPAVNGEIMVATISEGGTGGNADVHYALFSYTASTNATTQRANTRVRPANSIGPLTGHILPVYGRVFNNNNSLRCFTLVSGGGGGGNSVNSIRPLTYNPTTGALGNPTGTTSINLFGANNGSRPDDGTRHPINSITDVVNNNTDPMVVTFGNGIGANQFRPLRAFGNFAGSDKTTDQWAPDITNRSRIFQDRHHISRPGQQLYLWGQENVGGVLYQRMFYGKTKYVSESAGARFIPATTYVDAAVYDATHTTFVDYCTCLPSTTEGVAFYVVRNSTSTSYKILMVAYDIDPQIGNLNTPIIGSNGPVLTVGTFNGFVLQIKCVDIDSNRILLMWTEDNTKLRAKIVRKA